MEGNIIALIPIAIIAITFGLTWVIRKMTLDANGNAPTWLILVPLVCGLIFGTADYYLKIDPIELAKGPFWKILIAALFQGFTYAGATVLLWELRKKYLPMPEEKTP